MEYRNIKVGEVVKEVSLLGFGCMRFPMIDGEVDIVETKRMIDFAIKKGVNYIDTAYPYHSGKSETIVREILKTYKRESYFLADKLPLWNCETIEDVERIFYEQLDKCGVDYFDFYLIHAVNKERYKQVIELGVLKKLEEFKKQGVIRNIGFSFHDDLETFKKWVDLYPWDFCQIQLNYMDINHQQGMEGYEILTKKDIPVIIMEPVKGGVLAKFNPNIEKYFKDERPNDSIASWAFRWVGSFSNVKVILSGMSTFEQVEDNISTLSDFEPFTAKEHALISKIRTELLDLSKVDCTSCNYCMPCPYGVDIPRNFRLFNGHAMYKNDNYVTFSYKSMLEAGQSANACVQCNECLPKCPQFIEIPTQLSNFTSYLKDNKLIE